MDNIQKYLFHFFHNPNYLYLSLILSSLVILPPFTEYTSGGILLMRINYGLVIFLCTFYLASDTREFLLFLFWGIIIFLCFLFPNLHLTTEFSGMFMTFLFFLFVFKRMVFYILTHNEVNQNVIFACISGYLILGITAGMLFYLMNMSVEGAFNVDKGKEFCDYIYFSFITLASVGYGDITPVHPATRSLAVLVSVTGQLYLTILIAIIIGKYIIHEGDKEHVKNKR